MANLPNYSTDRFSFGPGVLYIGAPGTTPTLDIGGVKGGATFSVKRTKLEVKLGSPKTRVKQYTTEEEATLKVTGIEWNLANLAYALGAGVTGVSGAEETLEFGGDMDVSNRALRFVHIAPDGSTIDLHIFKAESLGELELAMKDDDVHEFPYEFGAVVGATDFAGAALADNKKLFKIIRTKV